MPFPPQRNHKVSKDEAAEMTKRHRDGAQKGSENAHMFPRDVFEALLKNPKVKGIRLYHGKGQQGNGEMIAVGVDADGNDMLADGDIFDRGFPCPPFCTGVGGLNG
jgi:hypothetical protein